MAIHNSDVKLFESQRLTDGGGRVTLKLPALSGRAEEEQDTKKNKTPINFSTGKREEQDTHKFLNWKKWLSLFLRSDSRSLT